MHESVGHRNNGRDEVQRPQFRADIQGLRAVAVILVLFYHAGGDWAGGGFIGVDVFFVISGFIITRQLFTVLKSGESLTLSEFYFRRMARILPASLLVIVLTLTAVLAFTPSIVWASISADAVSAAIYMPNVWFSIREINYLTDDYHSPFQHYWSLGVEEQFYVIWPVIVIALWGMSKRSRKYSYTVVLVLIASSFLLGWWLTYTSPSAGFFSPLAGFWELGVGSLIAMVDPSAARKLPAYARALLSWGGLLAVIVTAVLYDSAVPFPGWAAAVPVVGAAMVIFALQESTARSSYVVLSARPLVFIGAISYSVYLIHWPLLSLPAISQGVPMRPWQTLILSLASIPLAWLMYRYVEDPIRKWAKLREGSSRRYVGGALIAPILSVVLIVGLAVSMPKSPIDAGRLAASNSDIALPGPEGPVFSEFVPSNLRPSLANVTDDVPAIYSEGCFMPWDQDLLEHCSFGDKDAKTVVALFGDSHAAQWFPAFDELGIRHNFRVDVFVKADCSAIAVPYVLHGVPYRECDRWRQSVFEVLVDQSPDLIVFAGRNRPPNQGQVGINDSDWMNGLRETVRLLPPSHVVFIADTPRFDVSPRVCLAANLDMVSVCHSSRDQALNIELALEEVNVAADMGATVIDLSDFLCRVDVCGLIVGDVLMYRDGHHLTATASRELAPVIWNHLSSLLLMDNAGN